MIRCIAVERGDVRQASDEFGARAPAARGRPRIAAAEEGELAIDVVERALGAVEQDQPGRVEVVHLARELRPDRPTGSGDEDRPAGDELAQAPLVHDDRLAPQQVLHLDLADRRGPEPSGDQLVEGGHGPCLEPRPRRLLDGPPDHVAGRGRDRDEQPPRAGRQGDRPRARRGDPGPSSPRRTWFRLPGSSSRSPTTRMPRPSRADPIVRRTVAPTSPAP